MIAFDQIVSPLSGDVPDTVEMRIVAMVDLANDLGVGRGFVSDDDDGRWSRTRSIALLRKALAAFASRRAVRRKSIICPFASTARQR